MIITVIVDHPLHVPLGPAHVLLCETVPGPLQPALDMQTAAIAMGAPLEGNHIAGIGVAVCGWSALLERCSECGELTQGLWPSVFCSLCSHRLAANSFLLLMTSERQSTLRSLLPFLFCLCAHLCVLCSFPGSTMHCTLSAGCCKPLALQEFYHISGVELHHPRASRRSYSVRLRGTTPLRCTKKLWRVSSLWEIGRKKKLHDDEGKAIIEDMHQHARK